MNKVPNVAWVAIITITTMVLDYLVNYFGAGGAGGSWEYAPAVSIAAFALLKAIEVYRKNAAAIPASAKGFIRQMSHSQKIYQIFLGD